MKFEKIGIYKASGDYSSAVRALTKLIPQHKHDAEKYTKLTITLA
jgi:hypothetical protein